MNRTARIARKLPYLLLLAFLAPAPAAAQRRYVLKGGTLINGVFNRPLKEHLVVVDGSRITGVGRAKKVIIPEGTEVIDVSGKFIMPGLIDAHVRDVSKADWETTLDWGVTSVNCLFENPDTALAREKWSAQDTVRSPHIYPTATTFTTAGGWWEGEDSAEDPEVNGFPGNADEAREAVEMLHKKGIGRIALMMDDMKWCRDPLPPMNTMDTAVARALLAGAARLGMTSGVDAPGRSMAAVAVDDGATALLRGVLDDWMTAGEIESMLSAQTFYVPTFCLYYFLADPDSFMTGVMADPRFRRSLPDETVARLTGGGYSSWYRARYPNSAYMASQLSVLRANTQSLANNYVQIAMGTDLRSLPGISAHLELEYMVKAGLTPMQALTAATFLGAKFLGILDHTGTVETGKDADLIVLDDDPTEDITNTRSISMVIRGGKIYRPPWHRSEPGR